jgi:hypothetical protein
MTWSPEGSPEQLHDGASLPPPPPPGWQGERPSNALRWLIIGVTAVAVIALIVVKASSTFLKPKVVTANDVPTMTVRLGTLLNVANPIDQGLRSLSVSTVRRGDAASLLVGRAEDGAHERVAISMKACADQRFQPNGTVAMWLATKRGQQIFPDPSTATTSLLNAKFTGGCQNVVLGYTVRRSDHLRFVVYGQFPYLTAKWKIPARSIGSRS